MICQLFLVQRYKDKILNVQTYAFVKFPQKANPGGQGGC